MQRREVLLAGLSWPLISLLPGGSARAWQARSPGAAMPFDDDTVTGLARSLAAAPFKPQDQALPPSLAKIGYDQYRGIRFKPGQVKPRRVAAAHDDCRRQDSAVGRRIAENAENPLKGGRCDRSPLPEGVGSSAMIGEFRRVSRMSPWNGAWPYACTMPFWSTIQYPVPSTRADMAAAGVETPLVLRPPKSCVLPKL